jgi:hypothetical protein
MAVEFGLRSILLAIEANTEQKEHSRNKSIKVRNNYVLKSKERAYFILSHTVFYNNYLFIIAG